jgi:PAS domain S-box-containing protein
MSSDFEIDRDAATLLRETPDAVVYADGQGLIRFWNTGAERIFGHPATEALGQSLDIIIPQSLRQRHWDGYRKTMATGTTRYGAGDLLSVPAVRKDGSRISIGIAAIMRDVTKHFEEMKALRQRAGNASAS